MCKSQSWPILLDSFGELREPSEHSSDDDVLQSNDGIYICTYICIYNYMICVYWYFCTPPFLVHLCISMNIYIIYIYIYISLSLCYWYHMYFWWQKFPPPLPFLRGHGVNLIHQKPGARREQDSKTKLEFVLVLSREWGNDPKSLVIIIPAAPIPIHSLLSTSKNWIIEN